MICCKCFKSIGKYEYRIFNGLCTSCYSDKFKNDNEKDYSIKDEIGDYYRSEFDREINK